MATSFSRFLIEQHRLHPEQLPADLRFLLEVLARSCKAISVEVGRSHGQIRSHQGQMGVNVHGDVQKRLDVVSNEILLEANEWGGNLVAMASEEMDHAYAIPSHYPTGNYLLLFDPLDGSSNIDVNVSVGSIFSVLRCPNQYDHVDDALFLQSGRNQVAAGYAIYGATTQLILTWGHGVYEFVLDRTVGSFVLSRECITIPSDTNEFAINISGYRFWEDRLRKYLDDLLAGADGPRGKDFNMRWVASMVADVHRILSRGGIFMYPTHRRYPEGRLRLLYEANPMAFLIEQAGGMASNGDQPLLDIVPTALHQKSAVFLGSRNEVRYLLENYYAA